MEKSVSKFIYGVLFVNLSLGFLISLVIMLNLNISAALAFFTGSIISSVNFTTNGLITGKIFSNKKPSFLIYISYIFRLVLVAVVAIQFFNKPLNMVLYITAYTLHCISIGVYLFTKGKGSD